jgi:hypothetical protein
VWRTRHATLVQDVSISADADRAHLPGPRIEGEPPAEDVNAANAQANHWIVRRAEGSDIIVRAIVNIGNLGLAVLQAHRGCPPGCTAENRLAVDKARPPENKLLPKQEKPMVRTLMFAAE